MRKHTWVGIRLAGRLLPSGGINTVRITGDDDNRWPPGAEVWELDGQPHREDGPAVIWPDGTRSWWLHDRRHREGGPAVIRPDGFEAWYLHGRFHREDGPAIIRPNGTRERWEHGRRIR